MNGNNSSDGIRVVDVDQAFPAMVDHDGVSKQPSTSTVDVGPQINTVIRDVLGWRPRVEDPKAFIEALTASFRLVSVQGHVEAQFVPRGYAVQADLGAVSGGQASLYRRALLVRTEALRILNGLISLRMDSDPQDMEAYRTMVRGSTERVVDELGTAGGPRVEVVDNYFQSLTGTVNPQSSVNADTVAGQLGALRERFGLIDANVNTIEEEGIRTSFFTLVDMVVDLQNSWFRQKAAFTGGPGLGFIGTDLILLSRLMEATTDQVDELEMIFDSVLISKSERRTLIINKTSLLTLDGLLTWMRTFLSEEGRRIAEDTGRDGIVAALTPTLLELFKTFKTFSDAVLSEEQYVTQDRRRVLVRRHLPASCCSEFPSGMFAARTRIAVASTCRLLKELVRTAQRIGRYPAPVLTDVLIHPIANRRDIIKVEIRGFNIRPNYIPAFIRDPSAELQTDYRVPDDVDDNLILALRDTATADDESMVALFSMYDLVEPVRAGGAADGEYRPRMPAALETLVTDARANSEFFVVWPAEDLPIAIIDGELGTVIRAPQPLTWPNLRATNNPVVPSRQSDVFGRWDGITRDERFTNVPSVSLGTPDPPEPEPKPDPADPCDPADDEEEQTANAAAGQRPVRRNRPAKKSVKKADPAKRVTGQIR